LSILRSEFILLLTCGSAQAVLVTVDADAYPAGTDISNSFQGITLSVEGTFLNSNSIFSFEPSNDPGERHTPTTGSRMFGVQRLDPPSPPYLSAAFLPEDGGGPHYFVVNFAQATNFVALDYERIRKFGGLSVGILRAYDSNGTLVDNDSTGFLYDFGEFRTLSVSGAGIRRVVGLCYDGWAGAFDNMQYESVPEPAMYSLVTMCGLFFFRKPGRAGQRPAVYSPACPMVAAGR